MSSAAPFPRKRHDILSTFFVLRSMVGLLYALLGTARVRYNPEQFVIWNRDFEYPLWLMPFFGATQILSGVATILFPHIGLPFAVAVATVSLLSHGLRQGNWLAGISLHGSVIALCAFLAWTYEAAAMPLLGFGVIVGAAAFQLIFARFPRRGQAARRQ